MYLALIVLLLVLAIGGLPNVGPVNYGYGPSGGLALVVVILLILLLLGKL
jgi:Protein of unknown function (DUF3309).